MKSPQSPVLRAVLGASAHRPTRERLFETAVAWIVLADTARSEGLAFPRGFPDEQARQLWQLEMMADIVRSSEPDLEAEKDAQEHDVDGLLSRLFAEDTSPAAPTSAPATPESPTRPGATRAADVYDSPSHLFLKIQREALLAAILRLRAEAATMRDLASRLDLKADIDAIEAQLKRPATNRDVLSALLRSLASSAREAGIRRAVSRLLELARGLGLV